MELGGETGLKRDLHILIHGQWGTRQCFWFDGFWWTCIPGNLPSSLWLKCAQGLRGSVRGVGWLVVGEMLNLEVGDYSLPWHYTYPGPFQPTKLSWNFSFSKRSSLTIVTLASQTPAACTVCTTSFILLWLIDPHHPQGKRPFANIHVVKCHIISPMKFGCCKICMQAT